MPPEAAHAPLIFALSESEALGRAISQESGLELGALEEREYEGGEFKLRPLQSVRDRSVFVVQSLCETTQAPIALRLVRLLFLLQGLRDAGASQVTAVIPYLACARKDRRTKPRDPVYTRYLAQLLEATGVASRSSLRSRRRVAVGFEYWRMRLLHDSIPCFRVTCGCGGCIGANAGKRWL